jgi:hypothetical protein
MTSRNKKLSRVLIQDLTYLFKILTRQMNIHMQKNEIGYVLQIIHED